MRYKVFQRRVARAPSAADPAAPALKPARAFAPPSPSFQQPRALTAAISGDARGHSFDRLGRPGESSDPAARVGGRAGLPGRLKANIERLSGVSLDDVRLRRNSPVPARLRALAHTRGSEIHLAPGQERHLAHEAWHVVQQKLGRVRPTARLGGVGLNDDSALEREADVMGAKAAGRPAAPHGVALPLREFGARNFARPSAAPAAPLGGRVVQRMQSGSDEEEEEDPDYFEPEKRVGAKKTDPRSKIKEGSRKETPTSLEYETEGGAKHEETFDPKTSVRTTKTSNLQMSGPQFRNNAARDPKDFQVSNPHGLSQGQNSLNQMVVSHSTPSSLGMRAGKEASNSSLTSPPFNSEIERKEKKMRDDISSGILAPPFTYQTVTRKEQLAHNLRIEAMAQKMTNPRWQNVERIKARLKRVLEARPHAERVAEETRTLTDSKGKKRTFTMSEPDLLAYVPRRAYDTEAHKKYKEARGGESEGSDSELKPPTQKNQKKSKKGKKKNKKNKQGK